MGKTKVSELAQKLGLDNRVLIDRLQQAGIDVKSHASVLEDEDLRKFEAASAPAEEKIEEERISTGIIRRRRKEVKVAAPEPEETEAVSEAPAMTRKSRRGSISLVMVSSRS